MSEIIKENYDYEARNWFVWRRSVSLGRRKSRAKNKTGKDVEVIVYPNPSKGFINISFESSINSKLSIEDYTGKEVYIEKINQKNGSVKTIDLSKYSNGVYFIILDNKEYKVFLNK